MTTTILRKSAAYADLFISICAVVYALRSASALKCVRNMDTYIYHAFNIIIFSSFVHILSVGGNIALGIPHPHSWWQFLSNTSQNIVYLCVIWSVRNDWMRCRGCCPHVGGIGRMKK